jgi:hypothetical protein
VPRIVGDELWHQANAALDRVKPGRNHSYAQGTDPEDALCRGSITCFCGFKMIVHRLNDGPYYRCQGKQRKANDCSNMVRTATVDRIVWERATWIATDPGLAVEQHRNQAAVERTVEDTDEIDRALARTAQQEQNLLDLAQDAGDLQRASILGRLQEILERKEALTARRAEIELTRLALERESAVVLGWLDQWAKNIDGVQTTDFAGRRLRLAQMGIEAVVGPKSLGPNRVQVVLNLPFDRSVLSRDPDRPEYNWTDEDDRDYERFIRLNSAPDSPATTRTPDTPPPSPSCGNSRSGPCAGTAGGSPRQGRPGRRARSRS